MKKYLNRKIFEFFVAGILRYQSLCIVTGPMLYYYYRDSTKVFRTWKNCTLEMIESIDAYLIIKSKDLSK